MTHLGGAAVTELDADQCPHCGRYGPHRCPLNPEADPAPDDRLFDPYAYGRLEDDIIADWFGEPRRYP